MNNVTYRQWGPAYGEPKGDAYGEDEARRRWLAGETFHILIGNPENPDVAVRVELAGRIFHVDWLDHLNRRPLSYLFVQRPELPEGTLFLEQVAIREYEHEVPPPDPPVTYSETFFFQPDGSFTGYRKREGQPSEKTSAPADPDVAELNTEPRPEFGQWDSLIRRER